MNELIYHEAVCRTAPATPGLTIGRALVVCDEAKILVSTEGSTHNDNSFELGKKGSEFVEQKIVLFLVCC